MYNQSRGECNARMHNNAQTSSMVPAHVCTLSKSSRCGVTMTKQIWFPVPGSACGLVVITLDVIDASGSWGVASATDPSLEADRSFRCPCCFLLFGSRDPAAAVGVSSPRNDTHTCKKPSELYFGKQTGSHAEEAAAALAERDLDDNVLRRMCKSEGWMD
jgi:hypothetical protein